MIKNIIQFLKAIFGSTFEKEVDAKVTELLEESTDKYAKCEIEYYPFSDFYFPKYDGLYIHLGWPSGMLDLREDILYSEKFRTKESAKRVLDMYLEQRNKIGVIKMKVE